MSVDSQQQLYPDVFNLGLDIVEPGISQPILAAPFKTVQFTVVAVDDDVTITAFKSNQELPPDLSQPSSVTNQYSPVGYSNESDFVNAAAAFPITVVAGTTVTFNIESTGSRWIILVSDITDPLPRVDVSTFSNFK